MNESVEVPRRLGAGMTRGFRSSGYLPGLPPRLAADHGSKELIRLVDNAGPQKYFIRAVALAVRDGFPQCKRFFRRPDFAERLFAYITQGRMCLAEAHVAIGIHDSVH